MNLENIKTIIQQCQFCRWWDVDNGCIEPQATDEKPIKGCGCYEKETVSKYKGG